MDSLSSLRRCFVHSHRRQHRCERRSEPLFLLEENKGKNGGFTFGVRKHKFVQSPLQFLPSWMTKLMRWLNDLCDEYCDVSRLH